MNLLKSLTDNQFKIIVIFSLISMIIGIVGFVENNLYVGVSGMFSLVILILFVNLLPNDIIQKESTK